MPLLVLPTLEVFYDLLQLYPSLTELGHFTPVALEVHHLTEIRFGNAVFLCAELLESNAGLPR